MYEEVGPRTQPGPPSRRSFAVRGLAALAVVAALATGCQSGGGDEPTKSPTPSPTITVTPVPGSVKVQGLSFVAPEGLTKVDARADQANPKASYELVGKAEPPTSPPRLDVFVEKGDVGSLQVRTAQILDLTQLQLQDAKVVGNKAVKVPGATGARLIEVEFTCTGTTGKEEIPCKQVELLVQMPNKPQYGIRYGMATKQYDKATIDALVKSVRAQP